MEVCSTTIADVKVLVPRTFQDERGWFEETYSARALSAAGLDVVFMQDNESFSGRAGTVRGLHFQKPPHAQGKLIRVVSGAIFDVVVDIRTGSPTYGRHVSVEISANNRRQVWVPIGFAHGFCTLEPDTVVFYKTTDYYAPDCDSGLMWDDPELGIAWPVSAAQATLSDKDRKQPSLRDLSHIFGGVN